MRAAPTSIILATCGLMLHAASSVLAEPSTTTAAAPITESTKFPKATPEHIAATQAAITALVEQNQSPRGRDKSGPNAYTSLIDALDAIQRVSQLVWKGENGTTRDGATAPDFTTIYSGIDTDRTTPQYAAALAQMAVLRSTNLGAHLDTLAATQRSVRPLPHTKEHDRLMLASGSSPASASEGSGYLVESLLPELGAMRHIARYNVAVMHLAAADGDTDTILRAVEHNLALARVGSHNWTLIDRLVSTAIITLTVDHASRLIDTAFTEPTSTGTLKLTDPKFLAALDAVIARQLADLPPLSFHIAGERLQFMNLLPAIFGNGETALPGAWDLLSSIGCATPPNTATDTRRKEVAAGNAYYAELIRFTEAPWLEAKAMLSKLEGRGESGPSLTPLLSVVAPAISRVRATNMQVASALAGLRTMLAIRIYESESGALPAALTDLKPQALTLATDPYTGKQMGYRTIDAKRFELWVAGYDGKDNGGTFSTEDRYIAITGKPEGQGKDFRVFPPVD